MRKKILTWILAGVTVIALTACGGSPVSQNQPPAESGQSASESGGDSNAADIHIGIVVKSLADQHWALVKAGAEAKAKELGVKVDVIGPNSESDVQAQVDMIDNLIGQQVDALGIAPSSQDAVLGPMKTADDAGIPILTIDTDTTFEKRLSYIGTGNVTAARAGGDAAAEVVGSDAKAVILRGRLGDTTHDEREQGFTEAMNAAGIEILEIKAADSDAEKGMNITQDLLQVYDRIDLILCTTDNITLGVQRALSAADSDALIMSFDGTSSVCDLIIQGKVLGSVAQNPYAMGQLAVENAVKAARGETIEPRIDSGAEVIMQNNAEAYLKDLMEKAGQ